MMHKSNFIWLLIMLLSPLFIQNCSSNATTSTRANDISYNTTEERSKEALDADRSFWNMMRSGDLTNSDAVYEKLHKSYIKGRNDSITAKYAGFLKIFIAKEMNSMSKEEWNDPGAKEKRFDEIAIAGRYFLSALHLEPEDLRISSFLGATDILSSQEEGKKSLFRKGYEELERGLRSWPEFGGFSFASSFSMQPFDSHLYNESVHALLDTAVKCYEDAGVKDLSNKETFFENIASFTDDDYKKAQLAIKQLGNTKGKSRACGNTGIAPHNIEGLFLTFGDIMIKKGDVEKGENIYKLAKYSPDYKIWPFQHILEKRIKNAKSNVMAFRKQTKLSVNGEFGSLSDEFPEAEHRMISTGTLSCRACHQQKAPTPWSPEQTNITVPTA